MIGQQVRCSVPLGHLPLVRSELKTPIVEVRAPQQWQVLASYMPWTEKLTRDLCETLSLNSHTQ